MAHLEYYETIPPEYEGILLKGISDYALEKKGFLPIQPFSFFLKNNEQKVIGGISGATFYDSLYIDSLWVDKTFRHQGLGTKLLQEAEAMGKKRSAKFAVVHTMDWEGLPFYQKLGYTIEFTREGYSQNSKMFLLRKDF